MEGNNQVDPYPPQSELWPLRGKIGGQIYGKWQGRQGKAQRQGKMGKEL